MITDEQVQEALRAFRKHHNAIIDNKGAMLAALRAAEAAAWRPIEEWDEKYREHYPVFEVAHGLVYNYATRLSSGEWVDINTTRINPTRFRLMPIPPKEPPK